MPTMLVRIAQETLVKDQDDGYNAWTLSINKRARALARPISEPAPKVPVEDRKQRKAANDDGPSRSERPKQ
jgi:hypothetical protein